MAIDNQSDSEKYPIPDRRTYTFDNVDKNDPRVWAMFCRGDCCGIFQVESELGTLWCKRLRPSNIKELSDVISLIRPGPLESFETELYAKRKAGEEPVEYLHPALEPFLKETYGVICYQEQCSKIFMNIAGFTEAEAENGRKMLAKKKPEMVAALKKQFLEGCAKINIVDEKCANDIFAIIEKFQRYGFCKSHGIFYAHNAYFAMAMKCHYPTEFYTSWLTFSDEKMDPKEEIYKLVQDARMHNISILAPDIKKKNVDFEIIGEKQIIFGLSHIRNVGAAAIKAIQSLSGNLDTFIGFLKSIKKLKRNVAEALIKSGACDSYGVNRNEMLKYVYILLGRREDDINEVKPHLKSLTVPELHYVLEHLDEGIKNALQGLITNKICIKRRIPTIESKIAYVDVPTTDTFRVRSIWERLYLGLSLTCSAADDVAHIEKDVISCKAANKLMPTNKPKWQKDDGFSLHVVIDKVKMRKTSEKSKNPGVDYCFLDVSDSTGAVQGLIVWPENYVKFKEHIIEDAVVSIKARKSFWNNREQIVVNDLVLIE